MDRAQSSSTEHRASVPTGGSIPLDLLSRAYLRERAESAVTTALGRALYRISVLRQPADVGGAAAGFCLSDQPQAHSTIDERAGAGGDLSKAEVEPTGSRSPRLSLSASRGADRARQPGLEQRYHIHPHAGGLRVLGGRDRLVQSVCTQLGDIQHRRRLAQSRCSGYRVVRHSQTRDLNTGSRFAIYQPAVFGATDGAADRHQHGWPWPGSRQCLERLWRTVKYEHVYLHDYATLAELRSGLQAFFQHYNFHRPHQALKYRTPAEVFFQDKKE